MNEKNSKRVVIIEDIDSASIEQAIFILRNNGNVERPSKGTIVREAERIINAYVETIERSRSKINRQEAGTRKKETGRSRKNIASTIIGFLCLITAGILACWLKSAGGGM